MAKNTEHGRRGAIRGRTQFRLPNGHWAKRDRRTGEILAIKADLKPFKGVVKEKSGIRMALASPSDGAPEPIRLVIADDEQAA